MNSLEDGVLEDLDAYQKELAQVVFDYRDDDLANAVLQRVAERATAAAELPQPGFFVESWKTYADRDEHRGGDFAKGEKLSEMAFLRARKFGRLLEDSVLKTPAKEALAAEDDKYSAVNSWRQCVKVATVLVNYLDDEFVDLAVAFAALSMAEDGGGLYKGMDLRHFPTDDKMLALYQFLSRHAYIVASQRGFEATLQWLFSEDFYWRVAAVEDRSPQMLECFKEVLKTYGKVRRKLKRSLARYMKTGDHFLASSLTKLAWDHLLDAREVSTYENMKLLEQRCAQPKMRRNKPEWCDARKADLAAYFEANPEPPELQLMSEKIGVERLAEEYKEVLLVGIMDRVQEKELEIIHRVCAEVYKYGDTYSLRGNKPAHEQGCPVNVVEDRRVNCFSSLWLIAALLMKCGLPYEKFFYGHCNQAHNGHIGGHGTLIYITAMSKVQQIDWGFPGAALQLQLSSLSPEDQVKKLKEFLATREGGPVKVQALKSVARSDKYHRDVVYMTMHQGFTAGHLVNVGIELFEEGSFAEAEYAFDLALTFNQFDPCSYYYLGLCRLEAGDRLNARDYFEEALEAFDGYLVAHYRLGYMDYEDDDLKSAVEHFKIVARSEDKLFAGEDGFREEARQYLDNLGVPWKNTMIDLEDDPFNAGSVYS